MTTVDEVIASIEPFFGDAEGLTVSGGEPFEQPEALEAFLKTWRARHRGDVLVYSGLALEALTAALVRMAGLIDVIVADPFVAAAGDNLALRGSANQRMVPLTAFGMTRFGHLISAPAGERTVDVFFDEQGGEMYLAGIPRRGDLERLRGALDSSGHSAVTTQDRRIAV